jgi:hypothetical protein
MRKKVRTGSHSTARNADAPVRLSSLENIIDEPPRTGLTAFLRRHLVALGAVSLGLLLVLGIFAKNGWLPGIGPRVSSPHVSKGSTSWLDSINPFAPPDPTPTPQLSKEYIYAGSRLLAVADADANAAPPADLAVWRPSDGTWWILGSQQAAPQFGQNGDTPVQGDYDGDGKTDFAVRRPSNATWYILPSSGGTYYGVPFGLSTDTPAVADYDGDGKTDIAVWRPSNQYWYILQSSTNTTISVPHGQSGDVPAPADYDGDGRADLCVWHQATHSFNAVNSSNGAAVSAPFGDDSGMPVCGDYDGDGRANYAVWIEATWIIMNTALTSKTYTGWGLDTDFRVQNDYDGDGKVDIASWRPSSGMWYIRQSHDLSLRAEKWGKNGDIPVPAFYRR